MITTLQIISTFSAILPIIVGSIVLKRHPLLLWFVIFLIYGFTTDVLNFLSDDSAEVFEETTFALLVQNLYSLVDACFLFWFLARVVPLPKTKRLFYVLGVLMIPSWIVFSFMVKNVLVNGNSLSQYFEPAYEMILSVCAAYVLLKFTEQGQKNLNQALLWIVIGVFFCNFCTFFIHFFISAEIAQHVWFLGNLINIITMCMYAYGFYSARSYQLHYE